MRQTFEETAAKCCWSIWFTCKYVTDRGLLDDEVS